MSEALTLDQELPVGAADDFDFLMGDWTVRNRRLVTRWSAAPRWETFDGRSRCEPRLGGVSNIEQIDFPERGFSGMTLRLFDLGARRWSIYWISSRDGVLQPPVCGGFDGERGTFHGEDLDDGRFVLVRFDWLKRGPDGGPRWSQAFSLDGRSWETNWVMDFERR